jgi:hypothetical protein
LNDFFVKQEKNAERIDSFRVLLTRIGGKTAKNRPFISAESRVFMQKRRKFCQKNACAICAVLPERQQNGATFSCLAQKLLRGCRHEIGFAVFGGAFVIVLRGGRCFAGARKGRQTKKTQNQPKRRDHTLVSAASKMETASIV